MRSQIRQILSSTPYSRQSTNMFRAGRDAEIVNRTNYGATYLTVSYGASPIIPVGSTYYRGGVVLPDGNVFCLDGGFANNDAVYDPINDNIAACDRDFDSSVVGVQGIDGGILLKDGRVLIPPWRNLLNSTTQAQIYDPKTNLISLLPRQYDNYAYGYGIALLDGRVFFSAYDSSAALVLDVDKNTISVPSSPMPGGGNGSVLLLDGRVGSPIYGQSTIVVWDPIDDTWISGTLPPKNNLSGGMCLLPDGRVFVISRRFDGDQIHAIYDPDSNISIAITPAPASFGRSRFATATPDGRVFLNDTKRGCFYDPATNTYSDLTVDFWGVNAVYAENQTVLPDGRILIVPAYGDVDVPPQPFAFVGEKLPNPLPKARTNSPFYNRI